MCIKIRIRKSITNKVRKRQAKVGAVRNKKVFIKKLNRVTIESIRKQGIKSLIRRRTQVITNKLKWMWGKKFRIF